MSKLYYYILAPWYFINIIFGTIIYIALYDPERNEYSISYYIWPIFISTVDLYILLFIIPKEENDDINFLKSISRILRIWSFISWIKIYIINILIYYDLHIALWIVASIHMIIFSIYLIIGYIVLYIISCKEECRKVSNNQIEI